MTRRLPQDTVDIIQPAFYPQLPFSSAVRSKDCGFRFDAPGDGGTIDRALDMLTEGKSLICLLLPGENNPAGIIHTELSEQAA